LSDKLIVQIEKFPLFIEKNVITGMFRQQSSGWNLWHELSEVAISNFTSRIIFNL